MRLYCIRHGQSTYNAEGRVQGQQDVPLSELGLAQSEAVAEALAGVPLQAIYSSPLQRALQTATAIAKRHNLPIQTDPRLMEINAGIFQGKLREELWELYPELMQRWSSGDPDFVIPGGESRRQLAERGAAALRDIAAQNYSHVAVVSHGRLLVTAIRALLAEKDGHLPPSLENGSITILEKTTDGNLRLLEVNKIDHLSKVGLGGKGDL